MSKKTTMKSSNIKTKGGGGSFKRFVKEASEKISAWWGKSFPKLNNHYKEKYHYYLSFGLPVLILMITYIVMSISPYGEKSILTVDMDGQYVYFFQQLRDVYTGQASLFYTFERALGGEFLGYFTYYLSSPLSFIVVLFPATAITEAIAMMLILKSGLSGLTFAIYLSKTRKRNRTGFVIFSVMYALCSYAVMFQYNTMWIDALIWLPLIVLGIERLVKEGKYKLFIISLALAVCSNYYVGYMLCIFVAMYFFAFILSKPAHELNGLCETNHMVKSLVRIAVASAIALMISAGIIFSAYYALSFGKSTFQDNSFAADLRFDFMQLIAKAFLGSYETIRGEGTPNVYSGLFPLLLLPLFYASKKVSSREKVIFTFLITVFISSFSINTFDLMWHGFQAPIWFNYRYSFLLTFVVLIMAYRGYEDLDECEMPIIGKTAAVLTFLLVLVQRLVVFTRYEYDSSQNGWVPMEVKPDLTIIWLSLAFILIYVLVIYVRKRTMYKIATSVLLGVVICSEALVHSIVTWEAIFTEGGNASRKNYREYVDNLTQVSEAIAKRDDSFYRTEHLFHRKSNDNLALNFNGGSEFTSTFNASSLKFLERLGFEIGGQSALYSTSNPITDSLLGFKYIISNDKTDKNFLKANEGLYDRILAINGYYVYENPYALPIAYRVDKNFELAYEKMEFFDNNLLYPRYNTNLLECMLGEDSNVYTVCKYVLDKGELDRVTSDSEGGKDFRNPDSTEPYDDCSFYYNVTVQQDGNVYMRLPSKFTTATKVYVNDSEKPLTNNYFKEKDKDLLNLGSFKAGETVKVELNFSWYRLYLWDTKDYFVQFNEKAIESAMDTLRDGGLRISEHSDTNIVGTLRSKDDGPVFTTIPYDSNWKVYVDGERVETYKMIDTMLGFDVSKGVHEIELEYVHTPFLVGTIISIIGIDILILLWFLEKRFGFRILPVRKMVPVAEDEEEIEEAIQEGALDNSSQSTNNEK